ncbi:MAG: hypothetical protein F4W93_14440, partial [Dehalococcoidia bacterium]|nr:hypothetical protein [Dehalococcoidia bacterium]
MGTESSMSGTTASGFSPTAFSSILALLPGTNRRLLKSCMANRLSCPRVGFEYITAKRDCPLTGKVPDDITPDMTNDSVTPSSGINEASFIGITGMPEITEGADLAGMISNAIETQGSVLKSGDIVVVTQKVVSKAEGRTVDLTTVTPSEFARIFAGHSGRDPRLVELVISESVEIVRMKPDRGILITETRHGFVCANSGIDSSNIVGDETVTLLPEDPDGSARELLRRLRNETGIRELAVIITDTFG